MREKGLSPKGWGSGEGVTLDPGLTAYNNSEILLGSGHDCYFDPRFRINLDNLTPLIYTVGCVMCSGT